MLSQQLPIHFCPTLYAMFTPLLKIKCKNVSISTRYKPTSGEGQSTLSGERLKSCWMGHTNMRPLPMIDFINRADWETFGDITSNCLELLTHRKSSNPPHPSSFGNVVVIILRNSSGVQSTFGTKTFFSPNPASSKPSFTPALQGTQQSSVLLKHTILTVQLCDLDFVDLRLAGTM